MGHGVSAVETCAMMSTGRCPATCNGATTFPSWGMAFRDGKDIHIFWL
jgi:hypothetical protein